MNCSGRKYHEATKHSWASVRQNPHYLDWERQPSAMKRYPDTLPRVKLAQGVPSHDFIYRIGGITAKKVYPGVEYYLRTNPSAGALYPNELYFQARGVEGFEDGLYHFEVATSSAVRLSELPENEGVEPYFGLKRPMQGLLFLVSALCWRSAWKYRTRAYRYCLLDAGHLLGAIEAGAYLYRHAWRAAYGLDLAGLNALFGFGWEEFFLSGAICAVPEEGDVAPLEATLPKGEGLGVPGERVAAIETAYRETMGLSGCAKEPRFPRYTFHEAAWEEAIMKRRSIRDFTGAPITKAHWEAMAEFLAQPLPSDCDEPVDIYAVVNRVEGLEPGLYRGGELLKAGDFSKKAGYLCLEQALGSESAVTLFLTSRGCNYRALYQKAGLLGHRLYLVATYLGLGCSGIGAYYDDEVREFLEEEGMVLYALAVGR
ncbi:SagB/ThcOx family dehydrogenase [Hydrogenimonas sp.]